MYFETYVSQYLSHSAGLTIVNKDFLPSLFVFIAIRLFKGKSKYVTKRSMYGRLGNWLVLFSLKS